MTVNINGARVITQVTVPPTSQLVVQAATEQAVIATTKASEASSGAATATAQAVIATEQAVLTAADRVQTGLDVVATNADAVATAADALATAADRVQTGLDVIATNADVIATGLDVIAAEAARDAAIIGSGVYVDEPTGRAAVADGVAFKVQGSGDIAAYEYRRFDAASSLLIATYPSSSALSFISRPTEPFYVNGQQVLYSVVDNAGRALAYIGMDGVVYGKLPVTASSGIALTRIADGTYTLKLDAAVIDQFYGSSDLLAAITDSAGRKLFSIGLDGTITGKLGVSASGGLSATQSATTGVYNFSLDPSLLDTNYGGSDYLAVIVDSAGRIVFSIGLDGTITGKLTVTELVTARGNRTDLDTRLSQNLTAYGSPKRYTWGEWFLRETRMRLRKRALAESTQLVFAMIGDSWTHSQTRYTGVVASTLKTAFGDAGAGWTGFGWGFGGASNAWSGGNGNVSNEVSVALTTGWSTHYNSSVSPDIADIYTSTAAEKITATFSGSGNVSAVNLFYIAGGSGNIRYRWNAGAWTTLDISAGSGLLTSSLASVPTGTWTLEIENVAGTTTICGIDVQKTTDGVRVHKLGGTGSASNQWAGVSATDWQAGLTALAPNLVTILLGTNDQGGSMATATYRTNIQTMITRIRAALPFADIALIMPCENQRTSNTYAMSLYAKEAYELAAINNCAWLDLQYVFGDTAAQYAYGSARPWFAADLIHPDPNTGGRAITDAVYRLLTTQ